jgi:hypothetical protein
MGDRVDEKGQKEYVGGRTMGCSTRKKERSEGSKNKDKKIVMMKLIVLEKKETHTNSTENIRYTNNKNFSLLVKVLEFSLDIQSWYWHTSRSFDVFSPGDWLVCAQC